VVSIITKLEKKWYSEVENVVEGERDKNRQQMEV